MASTDGPTWTETVAKAAASLVPYIGGPTEVIWGDVRARRQAKAAAFLDRISKAAGERDFVERLSTDPRLDALFVQAVEAAVRSGIDAKRRVLANAVADASIDPNAADDSELIVEALTHLETLHVRALSLLADEWAAVQQNPPPGAGWGLSNVWAQLPPGLQAALVRAGVCRHAPGMLQRHTDTPTRTDGITDWGMKVLQALRAEGWQAN